jgi:tetratricopeptide (TPR) repeat protein
VRRRILFLPILLAAWAWEGTPAEDRSTQSRPTLLQKAVEHLAAPEPALAPHALSAAALCARGEHLLEDGGRAALLRAREVYTVAVAEYPAEACGHAGLSRALTAITTRAIEQDDALIVQAVEEARTAVSRDPRSPVAHAALALALLADLKPEEAEAAADMAVSLGADSTPALQAAAAARLSSGRLPAARQAAESAVALRPDLPGAHHVLGNVALLEGRIDEAVAAYLRALALSPDAMPSRFQLAAALEQTGNLQQSTRIFKQVMERHPEDAGLAQLFMAHSLVVRNSPEAALAVLDRVSFANSRGLGRGTVRFLQGLCLEKLQRRDEAMAAYREVIDQYPDATLGPASARRLVDPAYEGLARLLFASQRAVEAVALMDAGAARPEAGADLLLALADLYQDYRMPEKALPLLEKGCAGPYRPRTTEGRLAACVAWARLAASRQDAASLGRLAGVLEAGRGEIESLADVVHDLAAMRALSIAGHGDASLAWLRTAVAQGYDHLGWLRDDPDLEALRRSRGFEALAAGARPSP